MNRIPPPDFHKRDLAIARETLADLIQPSSRFSLAWDYAKKAVLAVFGTTEVEQFYKKYPEIYALLAGSVTHTGQSITERTALNCSIVWCCVRIISETLASLPLHLMQQRADGKFRATEKRLYEVLHDEPNSEMSDMEFRETLVAHALTFGNGYALRITRGGTRDGETLVLYPLSPQAVTPDRTKDGDLVYIWKNGNGMEKTYQSWEIFHLRGLGFDGIRGYPVVTMARQNIALALIQEEYAAKFFSKGGRRPYLLDVPNKFKTDQEFDKFKERWNSAYGNADAFHSAPVLEGGLKYQELGWSMADAQFLEGRQFTVPEICRWFLITPHMVFDLSHATYSNTENLGLAFYKQTMLPWAVRYEKAVRRCLLTPAEKSAGYYAKHNIEGLLRGDFASRMSGFATMLQNGMKSIDEVRDIEDDNPLPNKSGAAYHIQMNMQTVPGTGEPTSIEKSALARAQAPRPAPQQGV